MARLALVNKCSDARKVADTAHKAGKKIENSTKLYHRCSNCGRCRGYIGKFDMCRICIREKANAGELIGVRKASW